MDPLKEPYTDPTCCYRTLQGIFIILPFEGALKGSLRPHYRRSHHHLRHARSRLRRSEGSTWDVFGQFRYVYLSDNNALNNAMKICSTSFRKKTTSGSCTPTTHPNLAQRSRSSCRHNTSREYVDENKASIEREIRTTLEGTRSNLEQSGFPERDWPLAAQHHALNP